MARARLTEEEKKERRKEQFKRWWEKKKAEDPNFLKRHAAKENSRYHDRMENEEGFREKERERNRQRYLNRSEEEKQRDAERKKQYKRECREMLRELGLPLLPEEQRLEKNRKARERNRLLYATSASYRRKRRKAQKEYMKRKKERLEWEGYQQRLAMSQQAREILNY